MYSVIPWWFQGNQLRLPIILIHRVRLRFSTTGRETFKNIQDNIKLRRTDHRLRGWYLIHRDDLDICRWVLKCSCLVSTQKWEVAKSPSTGAAFVADHVLTAHKANGLQQVMLFPRLKNYLDTKPHVGPSQSRCHYHCCHKRLVEFD